MASSPKRQKTGSEVVLYSYWRSSCSYRVRIALNIKGIKYKYEAVHLLNDGGEQLKPGYAALNPMKELPTLEIDGLVLKLKDGIVKAIQLAEQSGEALHVMPAHLDELQAIEHTRCYMGPEVLKGKVGPHGLGDDGQRSTPRLP